MNKFKIEIVQPLQSPDLNVDDLAFPSSLDASLVAKENMIAAVGKCWYNYNIPRGKFEMLGIVCVCCSRVSSSEREAVMSTSAYHGLRRDVGEGI